MEAIEADEALALTLTLSLGERGCVWWEWGAWSDRARFLLASK
jgi:hypothetical protein